MDWSLIIGVGLGFLGSLIVQVVSQRHQSREAREDRMAARNLEVLKERYRVYGANLPSLINLGRRASDDVKSYLEDRSIDEISESLISILVVASKPVAKLSEAWGPPLSGPNDRFRVLIENNNNDATNRGCGWFRTRYSL